MKPEDTLLHDFVALIGQVISIQIDPASITRQTDITGELMIDSISLVSLMTLSEELFGISIAERAEAVANIRTVGDALDLIEACRTANTAAAVAAA